MKILRFIKKNIRWIIVLLLSIWATNYITSIKIGNLIPFSLFKPPKKPIIIKDPYPFPYPVEVKSIVYKIKWKESVPDTEYILDWLPVIDSLWKVVRMEKVGGDFMLWVTKGTEFKRRPLKNVPCSFTGYGTRDRFVLDYRRFDFSWIAWNGVNVGAKIYYDREVIPYIETGIKIKRCNLNVGIDKYSVFGDVSFRLW